MIYKHKIMVKARKWMLATTVALLMTGCSCNGNKDKTQTESYTGIDTVPMLIMQIQKSSRLYTTEYHIHKIITHDDVVKLQGNLLKQNIFWYGWSDSNRHVCHAL